MNNMSHVCSETDLTFSQGVIPSSGNARDQNIISDPSKVSQPISLNRYVGKQNKKAVIRFKNKNVMFRDSEETKKHVRQLTSPMFSRVTSLRCRPDRRMP